MGLNFIRLNIDSSRRIKNFTGIDKIMREKNRESYKKGNETLVENKCNFRLDTRDRPAVSPIHS